MREEEDWKPLSLPPTLPSPAVAGLLLGRRQEEGGLKLEMLELPSSEHLDVRIALFLSEKIEKMHLPNRHY